MRKFLSPLNSWQILLRASLICTVLSIVFLGLALQKIERIPLENSPLKFKTSRAYDYMTVLAQRFPHRLPWHENRLKAADWIKGEFKKAGYEPKEMVFSEVIAGKQYSNLRNVYAEKRGNRVPEEIIVVAAHFDTTDTTDQGAMDDASGVGVMMELANVFADENPDRTLIFLATDSEEFGAFWGARTFARSFDRARQIVAVINFDFVAPEKQVSILTLCDGLKAGFTPLWLREMALDSIRSLGKVEAADLKNVVEFIERALQIPAADHGAFLAEGIPAFNWVGQSTNFTTQMAHYHHTKFDRIEVMQPESLEQFGQPAEKLIRSINALSKIPENFRDSSYLKITSNLYLAGWGVTIIQLLAFIPFLLYSFSRFQMIFKEVPREHIQRVFINELKHIGIIVGALLMGYALMRLLPALNIVTQYETFPATQKSHLLYSPDFLAMALVFLLIGLVYWVFQKTFGEKADGDEYLKIRHVVHAILLTLIIILAFSANSYLATLLLLPPAYLWTAIRHDRKNSDRLLNVLLLIGGSITLIIMTIVMSTIFHIGVIYWYLFLAATYGLISVYTVVLFFLVLAVMFRLFRKFVV